MQHEPEGLEPGHEPLDVRQRDGELLRLRQVLVVPGELLREAGLGRDRVTGDTRQIQAVGVVRKRKSGGGKEKGAKVPG